jgi:hypothetical protein
MGRKIQSSYFSSTQKHIQWSVLDLDIKQRRVCYLIPVKKRKKEKIYDMRASYNTMSFAYINLGGRGVVYVAETRRAGLENSWGLNLLAH